MKLKSSLIILTTLLFAACAGDSKVMPKTDDPSAVIETRADVLPFACDLVSEKEMLAILGMDVSLEIVDGNRNKPNGNSTACFYKWDDINYDVSGVVIQVSRNPLPDEIPDYVSKYMNNKRWEGENSYDDPNISFKYSDYEGLPFKAIYNRETYKYYFGVKDMFLCSVVFNYPTTAEKLDEWFSAIATKMMARI